MKKLKRAQGGQGSQAGMWVGSIEKVTLGHRLDVGEGITQYGPPGQEYFSKRISGTRALETLLFRETRGGGRWREPVECSRNRGRGVRGT